MKTHLLLTLTFLLCSAPLAGQDTQQDLADVAAVWQEWCDAALAGDLDRWTNVYSDHAVEVFGSGQSNVSKANIAVRVRSWFENGRFTACANDVIQAHGAESVAFAQVRNTQTWVNSSTQRSIDYAFTLWGMMTREADGNWRILVIHWKAAE